jgi:hypothetical protein
LSGAGWSIQLQGNKSKEDTLKGTLCVDGWLENTPVLVDGDIAVFDSDAHEIIGIECGSLFGTLDFRFLRVEFFNPKKLKV